MRAEAERRGLRVIDATCPLVTKVHLEAQRLRREGYEIVLADSAAAALRVLHAQRVDLVLTDHKMPGMSGLELIREIAAKWPGIPRLLLTGWTAEVSPAEARRLGIRALVAKPWEDADLKSRLRDALAERG